MNASRHENSVSAPPTTRPITEPIAVIAANTAVAALRAGPFGKVVATSARPVGEAMADPTPCDNRAMTIVTSSQATAHSTEEMVNSATPTMKVRLRPMVSPKTPAEQHQPAERQHICGDHPATAGVGQAQLVLNLRKRDDGDGAVHGRQQLHAADRDDGGDEATRRQPRRVIPARAF